MANAFIGLGSNVGDRAAFLRQAIRGLAKLGQVKAVSPIYETAPVGLLEQGQFLNGVAKLHTDLDPVSLLSGLKELEASIGRTPGPRFGPREIDLDILLFDDVQRSVAPVIPHPEMHRRTFVLQPLADLDAGLIIPGPAGGPVKILLDSQQGQGLKLWAQSLDAAAPTDYP